MKPSTPTQSPEVPFGHGIFPFVIIPRRLTPVLQLPLPFKSLSIDSTFQSNNHTIRSVAPMETRTADIVFIIGDH